ncbi:MAG: hypothetical protein LBQ51_08900 [Desulfovibrio sp.]|jgi:hypothetical protein|nr:hypothetical protein [Desulfovibrio sp.]
MEIHNDNLEENSMPDSISSLTKVADNVDLGPAGGLHLRFAAYQLAFSALARNGAMQYTRKIQESQQEQRKVSEFLQTAREQQAKGKAQNDGYEMDMPKAMLDYMNKEKLAYGTGTTSGNTYKFNHNKWDVPIQSLKDQLEKLGNGTQQLMVFLNDYMGQYNSHLDGANAAAQQGNQTLAALLKMG